jgi:hypothetical protein
MSNADMSTPVTRGELRAELELLENRLEEKLEQKLEQKFDQKLALMLTKAEFEERAKSFATKADLEAWGSRLYDVIKSSHKELGEQLASHARAFHEDASRQIAGLDDKYKDLPPRVRRLENTVFPSRRR